MPIVSPIHIEGIAGCVPFDDRVAGLLQGKSRVDATIGIEKPELCFVSRLDQGVRLNDAVVADNRQVGPGHLVNVAVDDDTRGFVVNASQRNRVAGTEVHDDAHGRFLVGLLLRRQ